MAPRTLLLVRHAKADFPEGVADVARPLNPRGEADSAALGGWLAETGAPDLVLCSTATRARRTWEIAEDQLHLPVTVRYEPTLYQASPREVLGLVRSVGSDVGRLLVVGHNPTMHELALLLAAPQNGGDKLRGRFPTAAAAVLEVDEWELLREGSAALVDVVVPRGDVVSDV